MEATVKDQVTTVSWSRRDKTVTITGLYGSVTVREDNPVEIGLAIIETMTGDKLAPPVAFRVCEEKDE